MQQRFLLQILLLNISDLSNSTPRSTETEGLNMRRMLKRLFSLSRMMTINKIYFLCTKSS